MRGPFLSPVPESWKQYALFELAADDVREDLEVLVTVQAEAFPLGDAVLVENAQGTPALVLWAIESAKDNS